MIIAGSKWFCALDKKGNCMCVKAYYTPTDYSFGVRIIDRRREFVRGKDYWLQETSREIRFCAVDALGKGNYNATRYELGVRYYWFYVVLSFP